MTAQAQMQLDVLAEVLSEDPDVLTLQALAGRVLPNPRSLTGGIALARALRKLDDAGLVISDGVLVRASRPALHFKHLLSLVALGAKDPGDMTKVTTVRIEDDLNEEIKAVAARRPRPRVPGRRRSPPCRPPRHRGRGRG